MAGSRTSDATSRDVESAKSKKSSSGTFSAIDKHVNATVSDRHPFCFTDVVTHPPATSFDLGANVSDHVANTLKSLTVTNNQIAHNHVTIEQQRSYF